MTRLVASLELHDTVTVYVMCITGMTQNVTEVGK